MHHAAPDQSGASGVAVWGLIGRDLTRYVESILSRRERPDRRARGNPRRQRRRFDRELERLAEATGRSKSWLINEALRSYVANEQQFLAAVEEGKQAPRAGQVCRSRDGRGSI